MIRWMALAMLALTATAATADEPAPQVFFQSHRGGLEEVPENTLPAVEHAWSIPGAVPEVDLRTTADGVIVCLHDRTLERTAVSDTQDPKSYVDKLNYEQLRAFDAGVTFNASFKGTPVPALEELFIRMVAKPQRELYLDLKGVKLEQVVTLIDKYNLRDQILFVHGSPTMCKKLSELWPKARVMTWISDPPDVLRERFEKLAADEFSGVMQLQFHLHAKPGGPPYTYELDDEYLKQVIARLRGKNIQLQLRLFEFDPQALRRFRDMGVQWYVTDAPKAFHDTLMLANSLTP